MKISYSGCFCSIRPKILCKLSFFVNDTYDDVGKTILNVLILIFMGMVIQKGVCYGIYKSIYRSNGGNLCRSMERFLCSATWSACNSRNFSCCATRNEQWQRGKHKRE